MSDNGDENPIMPFGKHKGVLLAEVPTDYLWWVLETAAATDDFYGLAGAIQLELEERDDE